MNAASQRIAIEAEELALKNHRLLARSRHLLEQFLFAAPSATWPETAEKARYLITPFAETLGAQDRRCQKLIASELDDLDRLSRTVAAPPDA